MHIIILLDSPTKLDTADLKKVADLKKNGRPESLRSTLSRKATLTKDLDEFTGPNIEWDPNWVYKSRQDKEFDDYKSEDEDLDPT